MWCYLLLTLLVVGEAPAQAFPFEGKWELAATAKDGRLVPAQANDCGWKEQLQISADTAVTEIPVGAGDVLTGFQLGRRNTRLCQPDPVTLKSRSARNTCSSLLLAAAGDPYLWYEIGEGVLRRYAVAVAGDQLVLRLLEDRYGAAAPAWDRLVFRRV